MYKYFAVLLLSVSVSASASEQSQDENDTDTEMEMMELNYSILQKLLNTDYQCLEFPQCDDPTPTSHETNESTPSESQNDGTQP